MRLLYSVICLALPFSTVATFVGQTPSPSVFLAQAQTATLAGKSFHTLKLSGTAEWTAGSQQETGNAELEANADGSTSVQLNLSKATRTETQAKTDSEKTCQWTDAAGTVHDVLGPNCFVSIPWFAPILFTQASSQLPALLTTADDGAVTKDGTALHQVSYKLNIQGADDAATKRAQDASTVKVFFDPQTFLPSSLEYAIHPDNNDLQSLDVKVVFSDYRSVSGVMLPFHIEKYIQRSLQLKLDISNTSIE